MRFNWIESCLRFYYWLNRFLLLFFCRYTHTHHLKKIQIDRTQTGLLFHLNLRNMHLKISPIIWRLFSWTCRLRWHLKRRKLIFCWLFLWDKAFNYLEIFSMVYILQLINSPWININTTFEILTKIHKLFRIVLFFKNILSKISLFLLSFVFRHWLEDW